jgi:sensor histidine kinase YesM
MLYFALSVVFDGSIKLKLLAASLYSIFLFVADAIVYFAIVFIFNADQDAIFDNAIFYIAGLITSKLLVLLIVKIVGGLRRKGNTRLSFRHWVAIVTYPIVSCFLLFVIYDLSWQANVVDESAPWVAAIAAVCVLYFNILAFHLFEYFAERSERDTRERLLKNQVAAQIKEMERQSYEKIAKRSFLHDLRHHNQLLYKLVEKGEASEALKLISKMLELNEHEGEYVHTGNPAINALFNSHLGYAESQGIKIDVDEVELPAGAELDIEDICIIFANSLENAIEACQKVSKAERFIKVVLRYRDDRLVYKITNPTDGNVIEDRTGGFKSTKTVSGEHGLGIGNIEKAVNKYCGVFDAGHSYNVFTLGFSIPVNEPRIP